MMTKILAFLTLALVLHVCQSSPVFSKKSDGSDKSALPTCRNSTPCGWEVYDSMTGATEYYVQNLCQCRPETRCVRHSEHVSISAYVYRCRAPPT